MQEPLPPTLSPLGGAREKKPQPLKANFDFAERWVHCIRQFEIEKRIGYI